ncbi:MAG: ribosome recycling factor [Candidatus Colwellbacteria bacterium]|nr:ribosome recycling factor [Candidatus Colwellbacteria bacterium]
MEYLKDLKEKLNYLVLKLKEELGGIRTSRPTPKLIEAVLIEYSGAKLMLKQVASIGTEPPRTLVVTPWDKSAVAAIAKGIEMAKLGVAPAVSGNLVRVTLPPLTDERRAELIKLVKNLAEETRIKMRQERDEIHKLVNAEPDEDQKFKAKEELQKIVDAFNKEVEGLVEAKSNEIST